MMGRYNSPPPFPNIENNRDTAKINVIAIMRDNIRNYEEELFKIIDFLFGYPQRKLP